MTRMKQYWLNKWAEALESGEYRQGYGCLNQVDEAGQHSYCCLGVLADIVLKEQPELLIVRPKNYSDSEIPIEGATGYAIEYINPAHHNPSSVWGTLPGVIEDVTGLTSQNINPNGGFSEIMAANVNDHLQLDFKAIAALIRQNVKGVKDENDERG